MSDKYLTYFIIGCVSLGIALLSFIADKFLLKTSAKMSYKGEFVLCGIKSFCFAFGFGVVVGTGLRLSLANRDQVGILGTKNVSSFYIETNEKGVECLYLTTVDGEEWSCTFEKDILALDTSSTSDYVLIANMSTGDMYFEYVKLFIVTQKTYDENKEIFGDIKTVQNETTKK